MLRTEGVWCKSMQLFVCLTVGSMCSAQTSFKIQSSHIQGVELRDVNEATLSYHFQAVGDSTKRLIVPALARSVVLHNTGSRGVVFYGVRFNYVTGSNREASVVIYRDLRLPVFEKLDPNRKVLVSMESQISDAFNSRRLEDASDRGLYRKWMAANELYLSSPKVEVFVDCVVFDNDQFVGPDVTSHFDKMNLEVDAYNGLIGEMKSMSGKSTGEWTLYLDEIIRAKERKSAVEFQWDVFTRTRAQVARFAKVRLDRDGREALVEYVAALSRRPVIWK